MNTWQCSVMIHIACKCTYYGGTNDHGLEITELLEPFKSIFLHNSIPHMECGLY